MENPFYIHCHFFVKANDDLPREWYVKEAERIVKHEIKYSDLIIQVYFLIYLVRIYQFLKKG